MSRKRSIILLLAVGFLVSPMLIWMLASSPAIVRAQSAAPCDNCIWLPAIIQKALPSSSPVPPEILIEPTATPTLLIVPTPDPATPIAEPLPTIENPNISKESIVWTLSDAEVVSAGATGIMGASPGFPGGAMTDGYTLLWNATSNQPDIAFSGVLKLTLSVFSPASDYGAQKVGTWYVRGNWSITRAGVDAASVKTRHNPDVLSGQVSTELSFNPANGQGNWTGLVNLPMSQAAGRWARGAGTLSLNEQLNGYLALDANLWPEMK